MTSPLMVIPSASASSRAWLTSRPALLVPSPETSMVWRSEANGACANCATAKSMPPLIEVRSATERGDSNSLSPKAAQAFGDRLLESPRSFADRTSISGGIDFAVAQFAHAPFSSERRTIDVSGDGTNNAGRGVDSARDEALALGITINGLVILSETPLPWNPEHTNPPGGLAHYYRENVVGGPGAFVLEAEDFNSFGQAIIKKLIAEIADAAPPR